MNKVFDNPFFVLGGIYFILYFALDFILVQDEESYFVQIIDTAVLLLFLFFAVRMLFNKPPRFIIYLQNRTPKLAVYLASIGWIPYVVAVFSAIFLALSTFSDFNVWLDKMCEGVDMNYIFNIITQIVGYAVIALCFGLASYYNFYPLTKYYKKT